MELSEDETEEGTINDKIEEAVGSEDKSADVAAEASQQKYGSRDQVCFLLPMPNDIYII